MFATECMPRGPGVTAILHFTGAAEWVDSARTRLKVYYRTPAEWADVVLKHVAEGAMFGTLFTVFELHSGDAAFGSPQYGLDPEILMKALQVLQSKGRVRM